jgi:hypothetical protein
MDHARRLSARGLGGMLVVWLTAALLPGELFGGEGAHPSPGSSATPADVVLTVHEGLLSLRAEDVSLKGIVEAIGQQLSIEVVTRIPADERITLAFEQLPLVEALRRFRPYVNALVVEDAKAPGTIRQLIVVSKRLAGVPSSPARLEGERAVAPAPSQREALTPRDLSQPQPFRFELDPTAVGEHGQ